MYSMTCSVRVLKKMEDQSVDMMVEMLNVVVFGGGRLEKREKNTGKSRYQKCDASFVSQPENCGTVSATRRGKVNRKIAIPRCQKVGSYTPYL
jgi:hypothetical protein